MKKKFMFDICLNIVSSAIPIGVLQVIVYPILARKIGAENYGLMLTIYSLWMIISASLGNILNNARLLMNEKYLSKNLEGDFNIVYTFCNILNVAAVLFSTWVYYGKFSSFNIFLSVIASVLILSKGYLSVGFRLNLNYKYVAIDSIMLSVGYLLGFILSYFTGFWELIFIFGYGLSYLFCISKTTLLKEKRIKTELFPEVKMYIRSLGFSAVISSIVVYADKIILYPLLGGYSVSVYSTASIFGKVMDLMLRPITSVVLSYISKWKNDKNDILKRVLSIGILIAVFGYFGVLILSKPIICLLYPQWADDVVKLLPITTMTIMIRAIIGIIDPFILKFCNIKWQSRIALIQFVVYFISALTLYKFWGLIGFCFGTIIGKAVHLSILLWIYYFNSGRS